MALAPGTRIGHFQVADKLGEGGMGEVFRATDTKLGRAVALKILPAEMARDPERLARFQREARAVAALNHPNIVTIHSVEENDGIHFLTMELIEGQSLAEIITAGGLPVDRLASIATALADALAAAHEKGIVHRDLKPANVMMTLDGRVKVLDFGLAKDIGASAAADATLTAAGHTQMGIVMGTPAYMSPEQIAGRAVDHRTDIFSLGILLYQMTTGQRPFEGASSIELASAILRDPPRPLADLRSDVPADLARLIRRCLEKDASRRVQTMRDVSNELRDVGSTWRPASRLRDAAARLAIARSAEAAAGAEVGVKAEESAWVAVGPFKARGAHAELDAFAEGLAEEIVTGLSRFSYLKVIAGATGHEGRARYVIEGSVRQAGSQLRVAVQLVDTSTGAHLWADTYNRAFQPEAIFDLQDELVPRIVSTVADMNGVLRRSMSDAMRRRRPDELSPYEAVLRGLGYYDRVTPEEHAEVRDILEHAVRVAPESSDCWALLSLIYCNEYNNDFNTRPDPLGRTLEAARRAVAASPASQLAHYALAFALFFRRDTDAFRHAAARAVALNPMDGSTAAHMGIFLAYSGDWQGGCALLDRAMQLNPRHPGWYWFGAFFNAYRQGDYQSALDAALKVNMPGYFFAHSALAAAYAQLGQKSAARAALAELFTAKPDAQMDREYAKWFDTPLVEQLMDGLRKAGLDS